MALYETDGVLTNTEDGKETIIHPVTRMKNVENVADDIDALADGDELAVWDQSAGGQAKKTTWGKIKEALTSLFAAKSHNHAAGDITSGTLPVSRGGTGLSTMTAGCLPWGNGTGALAMCAAAVSRARLGIGCGTCSTAAATAAKVVTCTNFGGLSAGARVAVAFANSVPGSATLNVNGTGAKAIYYKGKVIKPGVIYAGAVAEFVYGADKWLLVALDRSTTGFGICSTAATTTAKTVTISDLSVDVGTRVAVKFTYAVPAKASLNINGMGTKGIYYQGAAIESGVIPAGAVAEFVYSGTYWYLLSVDKGGGTGFEKIYEGHISWDSKSVNGSYDLTDGAVTGAILGEFALVAVKVSGTVTGKTSSATTLLGICHSVSYKGNLGDYDVSVTAGGTANVAVAKLLTCGCDYKPTDSVPIYVYGCNNTNSYGGTVSAELDVVVYGLKL